MTLREIAEEAGVSISTVSRVINKKYAKTAGKEVQERIWNIVRRTGYIPNSNARNLKLGQSMDDRNNSPKSIACIFARANNTSTDPFFTEIAKAVEQEAYKDNFIVKYSFTSFDIDSPITHSILSHQQLDGVVILGRYDKSLLKLFNNYFKHVVYTGLNTLDGSFDQVICDGYEAAQTAVTYLYDLGHQDIGYIGERNKENRFYGYRDTLAKFGLPLINANIGNVPLSAEGGYQGASMILKNNPDITALFCANDTTAIGAIRALKEQNFRIPEDISVISIDDIDMAQYVSPMLTTIHIPLDELGKMTAKTLIDRINGGHRLPLKIILPFSITKRESCQKHTVIGGSHDKKQLSHYRN